MYSEGGHSKSEILNLIHSLSRNYAKVLVQFERDLAEAKKSHIPIEFIENLQGQLAIIWLCQDVIIKAYFNINELQFVIKFGSKQKIRMMTYFSEINPNEISRRVACRNSDFETETQNRHKAIKQVDYLVESLKGCIFSLISQISISHSLQVHKASGTQYLSETENAKDEELLFLRPNQSLAYKILTALNESVIVILKVISKRRIFCRQTNSST